jgi:hypothetical protein
MALRDYLIKPETFATPVRTGEDTAVAKVAGVAVAKARDSKTNGKDEAVTALENAKTVGKPIPVAGVAGVAVSTIDNQKDQYRNSYFVSENRATATVATPATPIFYGGKAVARARDLKTGEIVPQLLAVAEPLPRDEFQAQRARFRSRTIPQEIDLVDIFCPAYSGGMKGLTFRVDQLPGLIWALLKVRNEAIERELLSSDFPSDQAEPSCKP